jgi:hypothetical protein
MYFNCVLYYIIHIAGQIMGFDGANLRLASFHPRQSVPKECKWKKITDSQTSLRIKVRVTRYQLKINRILSE